MSNKRLRDDAHQSNPSPKHQKTNHYHHNSNRNNNNDSSYASNNPNNQPLRNQRPQTYTPRAPTLHKSHPSSQTHPTIPYYNSSAPLPLRANLPPLPPIEPKLASAPFTHASISSTNNYERLEFLGDAYLEIIATRLIYSHFPGLPTGRQAQLRERMIRNTTLAGFAKAYGFGERVRRGGGMEELMKDKYEKMLADVFEAFVAAVVLSWGDGGGPPPGEGEEEDYGDETEGGAAETEEKSESTSKSGKSKSKNPNKNQNTTKPKTGFERAEQWMTELWTEILTTHETEGATLLASQVNNRKDELNRLCGGKEVQIEYVDLEMQKGQQQQQKSGSGSSSSSGGVQRYEVGVYITGWGYERVQLGVGKGVGKKEAGMMACLDAFERNKDLIEEIAGVKRRADEKRRREMGLI